MVNASTIATLGPTTPVDPRFTTDPTLSNAPGGLSNPDINSYKKSGYIPGQMATSADFNRTEKDMAGTYILSNTLPQQIDVAVGPWRSLDLYAQSLVAQGKELYIIAGGSQATLTTLPEAPAPTSQRCLQDE